MCTSYNYMLLDSNSASLATNPYLLSIWLIGPPPLLSLSLSHSPNLALISAVAQRLFSQISLWNFFLPSRPGSNLCLIDSHISAGHSESQMTQKCTYSPIDRQICILFYNEQTEHIRFHTQGGYENKHGRKCFSRRSWRRLEIKEWGIYYSQQLFYILNKYKVKEIIKVWEMMSHK